MREEVLQYIWKTLQYNYSDLTTTEGNPIEIISPGHWNSNSGPDFLNAELIINNVRWHGSIEVHIRSSDWMLHGHQTDPSYNSVILHVVYTHDRFIRTEQGHQIPTLELKGRIPIETITQNREVSIYDSRRVPCHDQLKRSKPGNYKSFVHDLAFERVLKKKDAFLKVLRGEGDLASALFAFSARFFGSSLNADSFRELVDRCTYHQLMELPDPLKRYCALLGVSGLMQRLPANDGARMIFNRIGFEQDFHSKVMRHTVWQFSGLRPGAFPDYRIKLLADFTIVIEVLCDLIRSGKPISDIAEKFPSSFSEHLKNMLLINTIAPAYYGMTGKKDEVINFLTRLTNEQNFITRYWTQHGFNPGNSFETQGLTELYKEKCMKKKCLDCQIGSYILFRD